MLCKTPAKIRILSDIFTKFASWTTKRIKVIKRFIKIFWRIIVAIASLLFAAALIIQLPIVQTAVTGMVVSTLSEKLDGDISFEKIHLKPFTTLVIKNVNIVDRNPVQDPLDLTADPVDTLFRAEYIIARFSLDGLIKREGVHIDNIFIGEAQMNLVLENKPDNGDGDITTDNLSRIFKLQKADSTSKSEKEIFHIKKVEVSNIGFCMKNHTTDRPDYIEGGIDWNNLNIRRINLNANQLMFKGGIMSGEVAELSLIEETGFVVKRISGSAKVGRGKTIIEDLYLKDLWSELSLPSFQMSYKNSKAFQNFISQVKIDARIADSRIDFKTISCFAPQMKNNGLNAEISGGFSGYIKDFNFNDFSLNSAAGGFSGKASGHISGIPDIDNIRVNASLRDFNVTSEGIGTFISEWMPEEDSLDISGYAPGIPFIVNADGSGRLDDLKIKADITVESGNAHAEVRLTDILDNAKPIGISGEVQTKDLNVGNLIGNNILGPVSLQTSLDAKLGTKDIASELSINRLKVERLHANGYDYKDITALGKISSSSFNGSIVCNDPNCNFIFTGLFALSAKTKNAKYQFTTNIGYADLNAINIDKRGISKGTLRANANFTKVNTGELIGDISIADLTLENSMGRHDIGKINLRSHSSNETYTIKLNSSFANGSYTGTAPISDFAKDLQEITLKKELPALYKDSTYTWNNNSYKLDFRCYNSMDILSFIYPGLFIDEGTSVSVSLDRNGNFAANLNSNRLAYNKTYIRYVKADINNSDDALNLVMSYDTLKVAAIKMRNNHINIHGNDNRIGLRFDYDNHSELTNSGEIIINGSIARDENGPSVDLNVSPSAVFVNSKEWKINESYLALKNKELDIRSFSLTSGDEQIRVSGKTSQQNKEVLKFNIDRLDVSLLNEIIGRNLGLKGAVTGYANLTSPIKKKNLHINMMCDSTYLADVPLGVVTLNIMNMERQEDRYNFLFNNELNGKNNIRGVGALRLSDNYLQAFASMDDLNIDYAQPFMRDIFSAMSGKISGNLNISGPLSKLDIRCPDTYIENGMLQIAFTNVPYGIDGPFHIDNNGVYFDNIRIKDRYTGTGTVTGSINWDHLQDMSLDAQISVNEIEALDIRKNNSEGFYGNIFGTGNVSVRGPLNAITMDVDAATTKAGQLYIPLNTSLTAGKVTNLLRFKEPEKVEKIDPYDAMMTKIDESRKAANTFTVNLSANINPEVEIVVELDDAYGSMVSGRGNGLIDLTVSEDVFTIDGDYTLNSGNCKYVAMGLVTRDFTIEDGSTIQFNGDIMDSDLDLYAIYKTKGSLSTLLGETSSVSNKRIVNCQINITDKLSNPHIGLSIDVPDLNPMIKSRVESALSTDDKTQKQFLWLLISGDFLPDEQGGIVNNSTALYSNAASELLANQLNNIFEKLNIPLDLGLNYQANETGNDLYDVAVSTQLFNNRLVFNGNIGNKQYATSGTQNEVVGDLDIEYKLDKTGSYRISLFSHSADQFSNYLDNSQRNGLGFMYQTEFNTFKESFSNLKERLKKRKKKEDDEEGHVDDFMLQGEKVEISIEAPEENDQNKNEENDRKKRKTLLDTFASGRK